MHITLESDYAIRIVYCLAKNAVRMDAKTISANTAVTLRFSLKILRKLVASGIVKSFKGTQGGYEIAKPLDEITLYDIIETVEGSYMLSRCVADDFECSRMALEEDCPDCQFNKVFEDISMKVRDMLRAVKFSEVVAKEKKK